MTRGTQQEIANRTGLCRSVVSHYFNNGYVSPKSREKIEDVIGDMDDNFSLRMRLKKLKARKDRYDIYNNLPRGSMVKISKKLGCTLHDVKYILEGYKNH